MTVRAPSSRIRSKTLAVFAVVVAAVSALVAACGSDADAPATTTADGGPDSTSAVPDTGGPPTPVNDGGSNPILEAGTQSECVGIDPNREVDCSGKCGPVRDICTGKLAACGGCANLQTADGGDAGVQACDLATNTCTTPKKTCLDLGAECGTVKNTCGEYLDCPDGNTKGCGDNKECDPDTNKCRDCQAVTCKDLGFECGSAWLGCGEDKPSNYTDCGGCSDAPADGGARVCNAQFHTCEPKCTPRPALELCNEAKAKKGVECGVISNGCGGTVNCDAVAGYGCKNGELCGVRGIANRCDVASTPDECKAQGRQCGEITSACSGKKITCGSCPSGQVCNANGLCGEPCTPKTCDDFKQFECGTFDDGCKSTVTCGSCAGGICNNGTNTCCKLNTCAAGKCGEDLPNGCGTNNLDCKCAANTQSCTLDGGAAPAPPVTSATGMCCVKKTAAAYPNQCGTNLPDGCGGTIANVACPNNGVCVTGTAGAPGPAPANGVAGSCCTRTNECAAQGPTSCDQVDNSCRPGSKISCTGNCTGATSRCANGDCCAPPAACPGGGGENAECNTTKPANGCGNDNVCSCGGGRICMCGDHQCGPGDTGTAGQCKTKLACGVGTLAGKCGTKIDNQAGQEIDCPCTAPRVCSTSVDGQTGTCGCPAGTPLQCADVLKNGDTCGSFPDGCGGTRDCGCGSGQTCNTAANPNVCCTAKACPAKALGSECGTISNNCGGTISCGCPSGSGNENFKCEANKCACVKDTCRGRTGPQSDRCGGTLQCGG